MAQATTTFLELCQQVSRESGVISGVKPTTVVGQTGQLAQVVDWVRDAWVFVQSEIMWPWLRTEFSTTTTASVASYTPTAWSITGHSTWVIEPNTVSMYLTATGVSDEGFLKYIPYPLYRTRYLMGTQTAARPVEYSVSPTGAFTLGPKPDDTYTVRGEYWKAPQVFSANADVPTGLEEGFKNIIVFKALQSFGEFDEASQAVASSFRNYTDMVTRMRTKYLPDIDVTGSLV